MIRKLFAAALLTLCIALPISAGTFDQSMTMLRIMEQSDLEYKTELLENAFDSSDRIAGAYASGKLKETMDGKYADQSEEAVDAFKNVLIYRLGETNSNEDAEIIFTIFKESDNNQLIRTSAEALGKIGAVQYSDSIIELLEDSNTKQYFYITNGYENMLKENEETAWSCVVALERLHSKSYYEPLFYTRMSDYSKESGVQDRAAKAMTVIVRNPTSVLKDISDEFGDERRVCPDEQVLRMDGAFHVDVSFAHLHVRRHAADCGGEVHAFRRGAAISGKIFCEQHVCVDFLCLAAAYRLDLLCGQFRV